MSFMMQIDDARRSPLEQLAMDYFTITRAAPSIDFCRQTLGVPDEDEIVARRLSVTVATVRSWRDIGRRAHGLRWSCR